MSREEEISLSAGSGVMRQEAVDTPAFLDALSNMAGIRFNGDRPWDIRVYDRSFYRRILANGSLGFGEAYMEGIWDSDHLDELFTRILTFDIDRKLKGVAKIRLLADVIRHSLFNLQSTRRAFQVGERHYDIGNELFEAMLDKSMSYSCGYWCYADNLEQAQHDKLDMICRKLELEPGDHLLDIGCGWGGLARHAARYFGVRVTGITISREQQKFARERCADLPVDIKLMDYRELTGEFDKVVSVGMFEHVGPKNYPQYFDSVSRLMKDDGLFLLHTIGIHATSKTVDPWIDKYVFPNGKLPSAHEVARVLDHRFLIEDWHNFGQDYDRTLMAWWKNFERAWPGIKSGYDHRFYRMWKYYLMSCAGFFRSRQGQLWQIVLSKRWRMNQYRSLR